METHRRRLIHGALLALAACVAMGFANGQYAHPLVAWIAPVLMLRLTRSEPAGLSLGIGYGAFMVAWVFAWSGVFRLNGTELAPTALVLSAIGFLPFAIDRLLVRRLPALPATLVFPLLTALIEYGLSLVSPFGSWGSIAYSQVEFLLLAQLAALTGIESISFLLCWVASVAALCWEHWREVSRWRIPATAVSFVLVVALGWGATRLASGPGTDRVRVGMVVPTVQNNRNYDVALGPAIERHLLDESRRAAAAGARIIVWPEDSLFLSAADEVAMAARAAALARSLEVYLGIAYGVRTDPNKLRYHNRFTLFAPDGTVAWRYDKSYPVPGYEEANMVPGDKRMARTNASFGEIVGAICFDADHDAMLRQVGAARLMLLPSDDWSAISTLHARMVRLRAIASGVTVVRPTINGRLLAADRLGREIAGADSLTTLEAVLIADVPVR